MTDLEAGYGRIYGCFEYLRDHRADADRVALEAGVAPSGTARILEEGDEGMFVHRLCEEMLELLASVAGKHEDPPALEARQVLYWALMPAILAGVPYGELGLADALVSGCSDREQGLQDLAQWMSDLLGEDPWILEAEPAERVREIGRLVGLACRVASVEPAQLLEAELAEMRGRPYLRQVLGEE